MLFTYQRVKLFLTFLPTTVDLSDLASCLLAALLKLTSLTHSEKFGEWWELQDMHYSECNRCFGRGKDSLPRLPCFATVLFDNRRRLAFANIVYFCSWFK